MRVNAFLINLFVIVSSVVALNFFLPSTNVFAQSAGPIQEIPANHVLVGFGYGSDDKFCTLYWKEGRIYEDGTIGEVDTNWREDWCNYFGERKPGDDPMPNSNRQKQGPANTYASGWSWNSFDTSGGLKVHTFSSLGCDRDNPGSNECYINGTPANECYYQVYQQFDPITKAFVGSPKGWGSGADGTCNERGYRGTYELMKTVAASPGKVIVA
ncbi:MAG: hypothetical protein AAB590_02880, partial [Patescibacteria group bacterium]